MDFPIFANGYGHHQYYISGPSFARIQYYSYGILIQMFATLMWTKVSICLFLSRIPATRSLKRPLYASVVVLLVSNLILTLLWILQCFPTKAAWDLTVQGKCFTKNQLLQIILAQGIISAISDFALAAYPILLLARVQISMRKRILLCLLMSLGVITGACSIARMVLNWTNESDDSTWNGVPNWVWRTLEINFGLIAACFPAIYPGYRYIQQRFGKNRSQQHDQEGGSTSRIARIWLNADKTTRDTSKTDAMATGSAADPNISVPEAAILTSTKFGVRHGSTSEDSAEKLVADGNNVSGENEKHGTKSNTTWDDMREYGNESRGERSLGYGAVPKATTSLV